MSGSGRVPVVATLAGLLLADAAGDVFAKGAFRPNAGAGRPVTKNEEPATGWAREP